MENVKIEIHDRKIEKRIENLKNWKTPTETKREIVKFLDDAEMGKVNKGFKISQGRLAKYLDILKPALESINKKTDEITEKDIEKFEKGLTKGEIKSKFKNRAYSKNSQSDIKKGLKIFLKWRLGEAKATELAGWLDTRPNKITPEYLKEVEVEKLFKACKTKEQRFLIAVLFDAGTRAEEFHNIRYEDIQLPEGNNNYVKITLKEEYSKTKGRVVSLFWKHSLEAVKDYMNERIEDGVKAKDAIFKGKYDTMRVFLWRLGNETIGKAVHYHLFRHSSATYYADKMNRQQLCMRYGWAFSSDMPDTYISRAGVDERDLETKFTGTEINKVKDELDQAKRGNELMKAEFEKMKEQNAIYQEFMERMEAKVKGIKVPIQK